VFKTNIVPLHDHIPQRISRPHRPENHFVVFTFILPSPSVEESEETTIREMQKRVTMVRGTCDFLLSPTDTTRRFEKRNFKTLNRKEGVTSHSFWIFLFHICQKERRKRYSRERLVE
jgi:hypothetical protein